MAAIKSRLAGYTPGDTDLAWSRVTYWRALLASAIDQPPHEPITSAVVSGLKNEPALDILAGWLATRIDGPVRRVVGELKVELERPTETVTLRRPQDGVTATLSRTGKPDAERVPRNGGSGGGDGGGNSGAEAGWRLRLQRPRGS